MNTEEFFENAGGNRMDSFSIEYTFVKEFLDNLHINLSVIDATDLAHGDNNQFNIFNILFSRESVERYFAHIISTCQPKILYKMTNFLMCTYYLFIIPDEKKKICVIGPILEQVITESDIHYFMAKNSIDNSLYSTLANFYSSLRKIQDINILQTLVNTMMSRLWGGMDRFEFQELGINNMENLYGMPQKNPDDTSTEKTLKEMDLLQARYDVENQMLLAVTRGELHTAEMLVSKFQSMQITENRAADPLRNMKNYSIIFNSLFRKAAEQGKVHPIYINKISSQFAYKIEAASSLEEITALRKEMVRKYCFLVKNHSMSNFSLTIQKALTIINGDLKEELTLAKIASSLNINPSYLSTQFKKEVGQTLTDYVTEKRIQNAILLLNSTDNQIADIAHDCGIDDIQYFSKIFKRKIGYTPREYRKMLKRQTI